MMFKYKTSLREREIETTLDLAKRVSIGLGITRVTDSTLLDKVGIPVYSSIRPAAVSLCVNAGKGLRSHEAKIGAYMEAIEFYFSENPRNGDQPVALPIAEFERQLPHDLSLTDFCPIFGAEYKKSERIRVRSCELLDGGGAYFLPEALALHPSQDPVGNRLFGSSTNGLASGNSTDEATLHALFEVIERDVVSFAKAGKPKVRLSCEALPADVSTLFSRVEAAGLDLLVFFLPNEFDLPCVEALLFDPGGVTGLPSISAGYGLHTSKEIAAVRAITEAAQSRLSHIHGGRDDLDSRLGKFKGNHDPARIAAIDESLKFHLGIQQSITFDEIPDGDLQADNISCLVRQILSILEKRFAPYAFRYVLTPEEFPLSVVKIIVPRLEHIGRDAKRIGQRLSRYVLRGA